MKHYLDTLLREKSLCEKDAFSVFELLMKGDSAEVRDSQIGAFLFATAARMPTTDELVGAARSLRAHMVKVELPGRIILDTCGTGGSGLDSFNTSTAVALILASAGVVVAKHGNRAATSRCGSADVLEALSISIVQSPEQARRFVERTNFCFLFAPAHHPATKRVQLIRRELGFRTIFNFLGPLANPAGASHQLLGISRQELVPTLAQALLRLGATRALVVSADDGLDEISLCRETFVAEIANGSLREYRIRPEDFGFQRVEQKEVSGSMPAEAAQEVQDLLEGKASAKRNLVLLNAGAALYVAEHAASIAAGITLAEQELDSGRPRLLLEELRELSKPS